MHCRGTQNFTLIVRIETCWFLFFFFSVKSHHFLEPLMFRTKVDSASELKLNKKWIPTIFKNFKQKSSSRVMNVGLNIRVNSTYFYVGGVSGCLFLEQSSEAKQEVSVTGTAQPQVQVGSLIKSTLPKLYAIYLKNLNCTQQNSVKFYLFFT